MADIEKKKGDKAPESTEKKKAPANKGKFFSGIAKFFREVKAEFKKIVWFGKEQTLKSTAVVLFFMVVISVVVSALDFGFSKLLIWLGSLINL